MPGENCIEQGNVLVVQESSVETVPEASFDGGVILFSFEQEAQELIAVELFNIEGNGSSLSVVYEDGKATKFEIIGLGRNSVQRIPVNLKRVSSFFVTLAGPGAVSRVHGCFQPATRPPTPVVTPSATPPTPVLPTNAPPTLGAQPTPITPSNAPPSVPPQPTPTAPTGAQPTPAVPTQGQPSQSAPTPSGGTVPTPSGGIEPTPIAPTNPRPSGAPPSLIATGKVSGIVFFDVNGNGKQDDGEPGIPNVDVVITDSTGDVITLTTDGTGMYMAEVPIGSTVINIDEATLPPGSEQTAGTDPTTVVVPEGGTATDLDGFQLLGVPTLPPSGATPTTVPIPTGPPPTGSHPSATPPTSGGSPAPTAEVTGTPSVEETAPPSLVATGKVSGMVFFDVNWNVHG
jgi:hypothetical protein